MHATAGASAGGVSKRRAAWSRRFFRDDIRKPTREEIEAAHDHGDHGERELEAADDARALGR